jgi:two-component system, response regulator PdtaR
MSEKPTPAAPVPTAPEPLPEEPPTSAGTGGLRIVVAEDEALIRLDLAEMLAELGYDVVGQASDGE